MLVVDLLEDVGIPSAISHSNKLILENIYFMIAWR